LRPALLAAGSALPAAGPALPAACNPRAKFGCVFVRFLRGCVAAPPNKTFLFFMYASRSFADPEALGVPPSSEFDSAPGVIPRDDGFANGVVAPEVTLFFGLRFLGFFAAGLGGSFE